MSLPVASSNRIDRPRAIVEMQRFEGQVGVYADSVTFLGCEFDARRDALYCVKTHYKDRARTKPYRMTRFVDCKFRGAIGKAIVGSWMSIEGTNVKERTSMIDDCGQDGVFIVPPGNVQVVGTRFQGLGWAPGAHSDGVQCQGGSNIRILGNDFELPHSAEPGGLLSNACIYMEPQFAPIDRVLVARNRCDGGLYSIRFAKASSPQGAAYPLATNVRIISNVLLRHYYGAVNLAPEMHRLGAASVVYSEWHGEGIKPKGANDLSNATKVQ